MVQGLQSHKKAKSSAQAPRPCEHPHPALRTYLSADNATVLRAKCMNSSVERHCAAKHPGNAHWTGSRGRQNTTRRVVRPSVPACGLLQPFAEVSPRHLARIQLARPSRRRAVRLNVLALGIDHGALSGSVRGRSCLLTDARTHFTSPHCILSSRTLLLPLPFTLHVLTAHSRSLPLCRLA